MQFYKKYKQRKYPIEQAMNELDSKYYNFKGWPDSMCRLTAAANEVDKENPIGHKEILNTLIKGSENDFQDLKNTLVGRAKHWLEEKTVNFNEKIFPIRQNALIDSLTSAFSEKSGRIFFFAGASIGDPLKCPYPEKVPKLFQALSHTAYTILNPDRLVPQKKILDFRNSIVCVLYGRRFPAPDPVCSGLLPSPVDIFSFFGRIFFQVPEYRSPNNCKP